MTPDEYQAAILDRLDTALAVGTIAVSLIVLLLAIHTVRHL